MEGLIPDVKFIATFTQHQTNFWLAEKFDRSLYLHRTVQNFISVHTGPATSQGWISIFFQWFYHLFKWSATLENQTSILHLSYHASMEPRFCRIENSDGYGVHSMHVAMCGSRKYPDLHHGGNWKFQGGGGVRGPGNSRGEGGWTIKSLSGGKYHFIFDLSSNKLPLTELLDHF